ncbi:MAG: hypothetical protein M1821_002517 [Bathelium mastoideum]|nr:MAG: hypothetical protein M1821_002517 [Bathelium mastoideum]
MSTAAAAAPALTTKSVEPHAQIKPHQHPLPPVKNTAVSSGDYDTAYSPQVRRYLRTYGLMPPTTESFEIQAQRCLKLLESKTAPIDKFMYLTQLRAANVHLFYRLMADNIKELTPFIYTPTVGEACQKWHQIFTQPEGMYLSFSDRGHLHTIIQNWPHNVEITVVTDGSRILGLGDLGVNGMGIPVGKLALYTACAGIRPDATLPLTLDLGTNNKALLEDPLYMGSRRPKVTADEEKEFLDELMAALTERWPGIVIQYEDFKNPFPSLERYQHTYTMFNDDIQGTGAVILGGFINACRATKIPASSQRAVFLGAGSAGVGVAKQLVEYFMKEGGLSEDEARRRFWLVDSKGLVTNDRGDTLAEHKVYFSRDDNEGRQYKSLEEVVEYVQPTILMGLSTIGGAFTPHILTRMAELNDHPVIFPLSNPSSKSECTFADAVKYTQGRCLFASGSPFPAIPAKDSSNPTGRLLSPGQGNNMYVFPGIGLGAILARSINVTQDMIYASATALAESLTPAEREAGWMYPDVARIRDVSVVVARGVIRAAQRAGVDREIGLRGLADDELDKYIKQRMYDPFREGQLVEQELAELTAGLTGKINGHANGTNGTNGYTNGTNGHANGVNGHSNGTNGSHL